jgi:hypothetical protein
MVIEGSRQYLDILSATSGLMVQSKMDIKVCIITAVSERKCHSDRACFVGLVADVYSYPEDDTVEDPLLAEHLAHFGINFSVLTKVNSICFPTELRHLSGHEQGVLHHSVWLFLRHL